MKILKICKKYLLNHTLQIIIYLCLGIIVGLIFMMNPLLIGNFIDGLIEGGDMEVAFQFSLIFASMNILRTIIGYITMILYTKVQSRAGFLFNQDVIAHIQKLSISYINKKDTNYLTQVINSDTNQLIIFSITIIQNTFLNIVYFIVPLFVLFSLNWQITSLLIILLFVYIIIYWLFKNPLFNRSMSLRETQNYYFSKLLEQLNLTRFIKTHVLSTIYRSKLDDGFENVLDETLKMQKLSFAYTSLDTLVTTIAQIALFMLGGYLILRGHFTIGMFTIFSMYFNMMIGAAKYFFDFGKRYQENMVSYTRLNDILSMTQETIGDTVIDRVDQIDVKQLKFSYGENPVLCNINLSFKKGRIYGILGSNGTGKSTLVDLLMGLYIDEYEGNILINGISNRLINMEHIREKHIAYVEQSPILLFGGMDANTSLYESEVDTDRIIKLLQLDKLQAEQKDDDKIGEQFSGGEKQKITLVRAMVKDADVLILDEPTSAMDVVSVAAFLQHLEAIKQNKIIILITHDVNILGIMDELIHL